MILIAYGLLQLGFFAAANDKICDDIHRLSCAPGVYDDGTGSARKSTEVTDQVGKFNEELSKAGREKFTKILIETENVQFRKAVLSGTGLALNEVCKNAEEDPSKACIDLMGEGLTELAMKKLGGQVGMGNLMNPYSQSLSDEDFIIEASEFKEVEKFLLEKTKMIVRTEEIERKVREKVFPRVKAMLVKKIASMVSDQNARKLLMDKVKSIRYVGANCSEDFTGRQSISGILIPNAIYLPKSNSFKYCAARALNNSSEFAMAAVIAHELSHSVDPCNIGVGPSDYVFQYKGAKTREEAEEMFPFKGVVGCLRKPESLGAMFMDQPGQMYGMLPPGQVQPPMGGRPGPQNKPNEVKQFKSFCYPIAMDQINESFADWMATEILPDYISENYPNLTRQQLRNGYSNVWRGSCYMPNVNMGYGVSGPSFDFHPSPDKRSNGMILVHPKIRSQMGCEGQAEERIYCPPEVQKPMSEEKPLKKKEEATK